MSGNIHSKGIGIITGYLGEKYAQDFPLTMTASIVFEQIGINQSIAVTGSVNQKGKIQPIGGVNEKIVGFYEVCKRRGFNGQHRMYNTSTKYKEFASSR